jgi:predicted Zn-dependent protease
MRLLKLPATLLLIFTLSNMGCQRVPLSGRKQLNLMPESDMISMANAQYTSFLTEFPPSKDMAKTQMVKEVGEDLANAVESFMRSKGLSQQLEGYDWEFNLVDEDVPNAWCMPGGKVVVYTGILPYTQTREGLAVVMGHEVAHAIARHGNERMSQQMMMQMGSTALDVAVAEHPNETRALFQQAYGVTAQLGFALPYSRKHELEADRLGLVFMAIAGYNPEEAVNFWERMQQAGGEKPPEFLSTHPDDATRINDIKSHLPEAKKYYKP